MPSTRGPATGMLMGEMDLFGQGQAPVFGEHALGWAAFQDVTLLSSMAVVLLVSVVLAAIIAYHPATVRSASTLEEFEQPKTFIMYSMVGAVIAVIVKIQPSMALVVFGIGGLLRFRTNVGEAKDTGRVILVTVIGLCCGLELYVVAVLATVFGWVLIFAMESQSVARVVIQGLEATEFSQSADRYRNLLTGAGCKVLGEQKNVRKGTMTFVYRSPGKLDRGALEQQFQEVGEAAADWG
jgi:hypothetical protein